MSAMTYELNSPSLTVTFEHDHVPDVIPHDMALHIFRVAQEAVQNSIKHSHGHALSIRLSHDDGRLTLNVVDDGAGFEVGGAEAARGLGFISMHERLDSVGGSLLVESQPGNGTRIVASVPCGADTTSGTRTVDRSA
jgi:signal transduction histidine kinase